MPDSGTASPLLVTPPTICTYQTYDADGWALAGLAGSGVLVLALRAGVPRHVAERPAAAALSLALSITLLPNPAWAGGPPIFGNGGNTWVPRWVVADHLGSGELILDASGGIVQQRTFDPFGKVTSQSWPTEVSPRLFTGQRFQGGAGLYDFKARWYDADVGRFLSVDPILQSLADPQTHNAYGYVRNNPVNSTDPDGRCEVSCIVTLIYIAVVAYSAYTTAENIRAWTAESDGAVQPSTSSGLSQLVPEALLAAQGVQAVAEAGAESSSAPGRSTARTAADSVESQSEPLAAQEPAFGPGDNVEGLDPVFREKLAAVVDALRDLGYQPRVAEGLRTPEQQREKIAQGVSPPGSDNPRSRRASRHLSGNAADVIDRRWGWDPPEGKRNPFWDHLHSLAEAQGLTWGGHFPSNDVAHIELPRP